MKTIVKSMIKEVSSVVKACELFDRFLSYYQGKIIQISGPHISLVEGRSSLPGYIVSGSLIIEDGEEPQKKAPLVDEKLLIINNDDKLITGVNTTGVKLNG